MGLAAVAGLATLVVALGAGLLGVAPASAASPAPGGPTAVGSVPPEVQAAYDGDFLRRMVASTHGDGGQLRVGTVHQLFSFTEDFLEGGSTADPVKAGESWIAGVEVDGVPVGWQRTFLDEGGAVQSSGWNPDPDGAQAFLSTTAGALVEVASEAAFFTLVDGVVTPVKVSQWDAGIGPRGLAQVQADFAVSRAETEAAYACCRPSDGCSGGGPGVGGAGSVAADCPSRLPSPGVLLLGGNRGCPRGWGGVDGPPARSIAPTGRCTREVDAVTSLGEGLATRRLRTGMTTLGPAIGLPGRAALDR